MRLGRRLDVPAAEMGATVALYPHDGPAVIGTVLAVRAREAVIAPWGHRAVLEVPCERVEGVRVVEFFRSHERERICAKQRDAEYAFLKQTGRPRRRRRHRRRAAA